ISRYIYGSFSEHLGRCIYDGFYVGEGNKKIPNTRGIRSDIVEAFKQIKLPLLRWPGGCFADTYHWKDGIGPKDTRPSMVNIWWGGVTEDNSFGTHEFLDLCEQIGADPYFAGNVGSGTVEELAQWVQYVNAASGPMASLRSVNGREAPWKVRFWGVGNETWGCGGNMTAEFYANQYRRYATFMTASWVPGGLYRVASGANSDDYHWTEVMMRDIPHGLMEGVSLHHYSVIDWNRKGSATDFDEQQYFTTMQRAMFMDELVSKHSAIMDTYDPKGSVGLVVDEWGGWYDAEPGTNPAFLFQQNTMRDAMIAGLTLNIFNNHCSRVRAAAVAQAVNVLQALALTDGEKLVLTPTYWVFDLYKVHHEALLLPLRVQSAQYTVAGSSLPAISASASRAKEGTVHISLVNIDASRAQEVRIDLGKLRVSSAAGRALFSKTIQDCNTFADPNHVKPVEFKDFQLSGRDLRVKLPPGSVVVLSLR
ncbi:MAG TPA: alpha-L-arabinofuranosidase C-terminal domain-containing protein, partial [Bacteroidota bacterium]|nr:alpha-L-arabinofuranosidase C-terminal domain-containing protein [Bacteroidota bacterium]